MKAVLSHPSYDDIEKGCVSISLSDKISQFNPDVIVGLTRGGLLPGVILSHILNIPMNAVSYSSREGAGDDKNHINMIPEIPSDVNNIDDTPPSILVVDDIIDSGRTMSEVRNQYELMGHKVMTAALYWKEDAVSTPDIFWQRIPTDSPWIIFPYENVKVEHPS